MMKLSVITAALLALSACVTPENTPRVGPQTEQPGSEAIVPYEQAIANNNASDPNDSGPVVIYPAQ